MKHWRMKFIIGLVLAGIPLGILTWAGIVTEGIKFVIAIAISVGLALMLVGGLFLALDAWLKRKE